jgi:GH15 family glucan-1,4-alpha-glucosidase
MGNLDLSVIGNCSVASLITPKGQHVWFGFPSLDAPPAFDALLRNEPVELGFMDVQLADGIVEHRQRYLENTAITETVLAGRTGAKVRILDFCPRFNRYGRIYRPPMIVRRIEPIAARPYISIRVRPSFDYGASIPSVSIGSNHLRFVSPEITLRLTTDVSVNFILHETSFVLDRPRTLILGADEVLPENPERLAQNLFVDTRAYWYKWVRDLAVPFEWQDAVIRAAITLKLCSYEDTGGIVAALTTSIPEAPGSGRNWDYRFCWPRDSFFTITALNRLGATITMEQFIRYLINAVIRDGRPLIAPLYPITPAAETEERLIETLPGFRGDGPVRIGNAASRQRQNDVYGAVVLAAQQMFWDRRLPRRGDLDLYRQLRRVGIGARWAALKPDAGLWEFRTRPGVHSFSAVMCWAALHRLGHIARLVGKETDADGWYSRAATLRQAILSRAVTREGWFSGVLDTEFVDASVLLLPELGFIDAKDPIFLRTLAVVEQRLLRAGFVMRYNVADDFGVPTTAFLVCTFWYIDALARVGRKQQARDLFLNVLARRNHVGLLSEDIDPATGELWGNFPQTYSQVGLILSAMRLSRSWETGLAYGSYGEEHSVSTNPEAEAKAAQ